MKNFVLLAAVVAALASGCKKKKAEEGRDVTGSGAMTETGSGSAGSGSAGSAAEPAKPVTAEELSKKFEDCWASWNAAKWDDFKKCYTADAVNEVPGSGMPPISGADAIVENIKALRTAVPDEKGDIQLELINGHHLVSVVLVSGTNSGPLKMGPMEMPASNKKIGFFLAQDVEAADSGQAKKETEYFDLATWLGQMNPSKDHPVRAAVDKLPMAKEVVIAKDDDKEKANLEADKKWVDAFNKHDVKAWSDMLSDKVVWSEQPDDKDLNKKEIVAGTQDLWKAFSDVKLNVASTWGAGDYVVVTGTMEGTNDGDSKMMKMKKTGKKVNVPYLEIDKIEGGKVTNAWVFFQGMAFAQQLGLMPMPGAAPAGGAAGSAAGSAAKAEKHDEKMEKAEKAEKAEKKDDKAGAPVKKDDTKPETK